MQKTLAALIVALCSTSAFADYSPGSFVNAYAIPCTPYATGPEVLVMSQAGVFYPSANQLNKIGDVYYVGITVGTVGMNCSGYTAATLEMFLPPNTQPAISATNPVVCGRANNGTFVTVPAADCPQSLTAGYRGGLMLPKVYTIPYGSTYYLSIPVMSTKPLRGIASSTDKVRFGVNSISADSAWLFPEAWVFVEDRLPTIDVGASPTSNVAKRSFSAKVNVYTWYRAGKISFEYGTTTAYGTVSDSYEVEEAVGFTADSDVLGLRPGTTYHWRVRFVANDGTTVVSPDQTVTTLPPDRFVLSIVSATGGSVARAPDAADYEELTVVTVTATAQAGYRFTGWKLDGTSAGTSSQMTVTMDRVHEVAATFEQLPMDMPPPPPEPMPETPPSMNPAAPPPPPQMHVEPIPAPEAPIEPMQGGCQAAPASAMVLAAIALMLRRRR